MSKGSTPRPFAVDADTFADNWARTFPNDNNGRRPARLTADGARENTEAAQRSEHVEEGPVRQPGRA